MALIEAIRREIVYALMRSNGDRTLAAEDLMIGRTTLYRKMRGLEIQPWEYGSNSHRPVPAMSFQGPL